MPPKIPKITPSKTRLEWTLEAAAIVVLVLHLVATAYFVRHLPTIIPTHFGLNGVPNRFGNKTSLWFLPMISVFLQFLISIISLAPEAFKYSKKITAENAEQEYRLGRTFLTLLKSWLAMFLFGLSWLIFQTIDSGDGTLSHWFIGAALVALLLPTVGYILNRRRSDSA